MIQWKKEKESESGKECEWYKLQTNTLSVETRVCVKVLCAMYMTFVSNCYWKWWEKLATMIFIYCIYVVNTIIVPCTFYFTVYCKCICVPVQYKRRRKISIIRVITRFIIDFILIFKWTYPTVLNAIYCLLWCTCTWKIVRM